MNPQIRRLVLDFGPLLIFAATYFVKGLFAAIAVFMVAITIALILGYIAERKLSPMPIFTCAVVLVFGGLALYLKSEAFFKIKVTFVYGLFGSILLGGLAFKRLFIQYAFTYAVELDEAGWRKLTVRWGVFFVFLAVLNEVIWRNFSTTVWVYGKFGMIGLTLLFALAQTPLLMKHQLPDTGGDKNAQQ
jgi:intracellular septation protein